MSRTSILFIVLALAAALAMGLPACDKGSPSPAPEAAPQPTPAEPAAKAAEPAAKAAEPAASPTEGAPPAQAAKDPKEGESTLRIKELPFAGKAEASDGKSLIEARALVTTMAQELKRSTAAVVMAGKNKDKVDAIGADFQKLNKTMSKRMEAISERLTPDELVQFEEHTRVVLSPLINQLLQAFFSSGGMKPDGAGPNGTTKLVPKTQGTTTALAPSAAGAAAPAAPAPAPTSTPTATPVAAALGAGATGKPAEGGAAASAPAKPAPDALQLVVAKAGIDSMAKELSGIVERIRAANNDKAQLRQINKDYTEINQKHAASIPKLVAVLNEQQKAAFGEYLKARLMPVSSQLVEAFTAAGATPNQ